MFCGRLSYSGGDLLIAAAVEQQQGPPGDSHGKEKGDSTGEGGGEGAGEEEGGIPVSGSQGTMDDPLAQQQKREAAVTAEVQSNFPELCVRVVDFVRPLAGGQSLTSTAPASALGAPLVIVIDESLEEGSLRNVQSAVVVSVVVQWARRSSEVETRGSGTGLGTIPYAMASTSANR